MPLVRRSGSRALGIAVFTASLVAVAVTVAPGAGAQATADPPAAGAGAAALRAQADELSSRYFSALERVHALDDDIARNEQAVADFTALAKKARHNARVRALIAYTTSGTQLAALLDGGDSLDTARRAHLIDRVNAHDESVFAKLRAATRDLHKQQNVLRETRQAQADALNELRDQGAAIDAKLAQAEQQEEAARTAVAAAALAPTTTTPATTLAPQSSAAPTTTTAPPITTTTTAPPVAPVPPPNYVGTPGVNPHHDDPFLTCVRQRESGGNYGAVNPAGPYLGAYQFLQATWNLTASHAGRSALVGVPANVATAYDQDDMAWALYQWQGAAPWGGGCP